MAVVIAFSEVLAATGTPFTEVVPGERRMNILGIGPPEMMVIAVIALLVFGPGKLPEVMGQAGKLVRDFRKMSAELSGEFEKTIAEAKDATSGLQAELGGMTKEVNSVTRSVKKDLGLNKSAGTSNRAKSVASKTGTTSKSSSAAKSGTGATSSRAGAKSSPSSAGSRTSSTTTTRNTAAKKPPAPVASREDPSADISLFEPEAIERPRRARKAVPSVINDPTPRQSAGSGIPTASSDESRAPVAVADGDDALNRARQRRRNAGYARPAG